MVTAILVVLVASPAAAQFNAIELNALSRSGGQSGTEFDLRTVSGNRLDEVDQLRFSDPRITAQLVTTDPLPLSEDRVANYGNFQVKIAPDTPTGRYEVRAVGRHGVSNPPPFWLAN